MASPNKRPREAEDKDQEGQRHTAIRPRLDIQKQNDPKSMSEGIMALGSIPKPPPRGEPLVANSKLSQIVLKHIAANEYEHEPLSLDPKEDQIRLLVLHEGKPHDQIHCSFLVCKLSDAWQKYEALSYYWGTENDSEEIRIRTLNQGGPTLKGKRRLKRGVIQSRGKGFHIRPNLHRALMQLRIESRPLCLWVDALCIDQDNEEEKTQQVQKMARIYSTALRVLIWLGTGNAKCEEGLDFVTKEVLNLKVFDARVKDEKSPAKWDALVELMRQDWFSRRWVIQELALARDAIILYNKKSVKWKDFADGIAIFATRFDDIKHLFRSSRDYDYNPEYLGDLEALGAKILVDMTFNNFRRSPGSPDGVERLSSLEALVSRLLKSESSDPKDTVYALLSIYRKDGREEEELVPNYEKSIIEVYRDFTKYCVATSGSIDIICRHWAPAGWSKSATLQHTRISRKKKNRERKVNAKMPSWVPLLVDSPFGAPRQVPPGRVNGDSLVGHPDRKCYNACGGKPAKPVRFENIPLFITLAEEGRSVSQPKIAAPIPDASKPFQSQEVAGQSHRGQEDPSNLESPISPGSSPSSESAQSAVTAPPEDHTQELPPVNAFFMSVTGIHIDTVTRVSARIPRGLLTKECLEMGGWRGRGRGRDDTQQEVPEELWRTLVAGRGPEGGEPPPFYSRACLESLRNSDPSGDINMPSLIASPQTPSIVRDFLKRVQSIVCNRLFVRARSNTRDLFGLGPKGAEVGDLICVLFGCSVPVILRAQKDPQSLKITHHEIIGECYIYGWMDGEAITKIKETRVFKLG